jgi:UDP:flavonoid glycosyltransferase YjiC (YdhE family)
VANIMLVAWDGGGNVPPAIGIGTELKRRGDTIRFLGQAQQRDAIEDAGLRFEPYSRSLRRWSSAAPKAGTVGIFAALTAIAARSLGDDLVAAVRREPADVVVIDCALRSVLRAAEQARMRRAVLVHSFYGRRSSAWEPVRLRGCAARRRPVRRGRRVGPRCHPS